MKSAAFLLLTKMIVRAGGIDSRRSKRHSRFLASSTYMICLPSAKLRLRKVVNYLLGNVHMSRADTPDLDTNVILGHVLFGHSACFLGESG